jgi:hypothetical protein
MNERIWGLGFDASARKNEGRGFDANADGDGED